MAVESGDVTDPSSLPDPYSRLAFLINNYLRRLRNPEKSPLVGELAKYDLGLGNPALREEQVRGYCELACTTFPTALIRKFHADFLRDIPQLMGWERDDEEHDKWIDEEMTDERRVEEIATALGFSHPLACRASAYFLAEDLKDTIHTLDQHSTGRKEMQGCAISAVEGVVAILCRLVSFHGRVLFGSDYVAQLLGLGVISKNAANTLKKWQEGSKKQKIEEQYSPDLSDLIPILRGLNGFVAGSAPQAKLFQNLYRPQQENRSPDESLPNDKRWIPELISKESLGQLEPLRLARDAFAHKMDKMTDTEARTKALESAKRALTLVQSLRDETFPAVIVMQRQISIEHGGVRLDYQDEEGKLQTARFAQRPVPFMPRVEIFYHQPLSPTDGAILISPPVFVPVDEQLGGMLT